ncbi:serine hydrolase domain-containing protein [Microbacterium gorillae]|uniref:serine hydrolase domain-containing protein n=1 Tax=Microbacterium gorillae TaxID=1231063 RepID=UPI00058B31C1|nr:serine hydrolase domain-containing protein [Microbacterium gorillae]
MQGLETAIRTAVADGIPGVIAGVTDRTATTWLGAAGVRRLGEDEPVGTDDVIALYSASKAVTATAALQCVEDGLLDLDAPASEYLPEIAEVPVLVDIDADGDVTTRPPRTPITARSLLLHTSGFGYDMFDPRLALLARRRSANGRTAPRDVLHTPLLHDPGEAWTYGISLDWLGLIVAAVRGQRLEDVMRTRIFEPCGMTSTSFDVSADMRARLVPPHLRRRDGTLRASGAQPPEQAEVDMGGQGLFSTVPDFLAFLRVWLGDGSAPGGRVLRAETLEWARRSAPGVTVHPLRTAIPALTLDADPTRGHPHSWAYSFLHQDVDIPHGRRAGTLSWAGLANVHYWIDPASEVAAMWTAQLMPWFDPTARSGLESFEDAVYRT